VTLTVPNPPTEVPGNFITSAWSNANILNGLNFLANPPIFSAAQTSVQALANGAFVAVTWPTPAYDPYGGYAAGNPSRYTPTAPGWYFAIGNIGWASNATGGRVAEICKNGSANVVNQVAAGNAGAAFNTVAGVVSLVQCNGTTDYFELYSDQNSGGPLNSVIAVTSLTVLWAHA
jgi:hypothetical protein